MSRLEPLDEKKLEGEVVDIPLREPKKCEHYFEYASSQEIECVECGVGLYVGFGDIVQDGHLYHEGELVV